MGGGEYGQTEPCSDLGKRHSDSETLKKNSVFKGLGQSITLRIHIGQHIGLAYNVEISYSLIGFSGPHHLVNMFSMFAPRLKLLQVW